MPLADFPRHPLLFCPSPVLRIDRLYSDSDRRPVELAVNWFHPDHYSYRVRLRRSGA